MTKSEKPSFVFRNTSLSTLHRLLEFSPVEGFQHNEDNTLDLDFLVVDEASMLDLLLTNHLLKAVRPGTHVLFVRDIDQLPSVGASDVLRNLIHSSVDHTLERHLPAGG